MSKLRKSILIIVILVIAVAASLATALALYATGTIKTDPIELEFKLRPQEKVYDGTPLELKNVSWDVPANSDIQLSKGSLISGHSVNVEFTGSQTNVGVSRSDANIKIYDENGFNVTNEYTIKVIGDELKVTTKPVSINMPSQKVVYNGSKILFTEYETTGGTSLCAGHKIYGSTDAAFINVGDSVPSDLFPLIFDVAGNDVTANYEILEFKKGGIEVEPREISVRPVSCEKVYDGTDLRATQLEFISGSLVEGQRIEYVIGEDYENSLIEVGETETYVTAVRILDTVNGEEVDVTANYAVNTDEPGILRVTPRPLTVTAKSGAYYYDGSVHSFKDDNTLLSVEGLAVKDEFISVHYSGEITDAGITENVIESVELSARNENYDIKYVNGTIEVLPLPVKVTLSGEEHTVYNGEVQSPTLGGVDDGNNPLNSRYFNVQPTVAPDSEEPFTLLNYTHFEVVSDAREIRDAGEYRYTVRFADKKFYNNFILEIPESGYLTVDARQIKVTTGTSETYYNARPLTDESYEIDEGVLVEGHGLKAPLNIPSLTNAGVIANEYRMTVADKNGADVTKNYEIAYEYGKLTVNKLPVTVTLNNYEGEQAFTYSGRAVNLTAAEAIYEITTDAEGATVNGVIDSGDFTVVFAQEALNASETAYPYTVKFTDKEFSKNFETTVTDGRVKVNKLDVTVKINDINRVYNGEEHVFDVYAAIQSISNLSTGLTRDDFEISFAGNETTHKSANDYPYTVKFCAGSAGKEVNHNLTVQSVTDADSRNANLKIAKFEIAVSTESLAFVYNGSAQSSNQFSSDTLANSNHVITATAKNSVTNVGDEKENALQYVIKDKKDATSNLTANYDIKENNGRLTVTPRRVTITAKSGSYVYDGTSHTFARDLFPLSVDGLVGGDRISSVVYTGAITDVGKTDNVINSYTLSGRAANYDIQKVNGTIEVTRRNVTITTPTAEHVYDGMPFSETGGIQISGLPSENAINFSVELSDDAEPYYIINAGTEQNVFPCTVYLTDGVTRDVTNNLTITYNYGTLTVTPLTVNVTLNNYENAFTYDGTAKEISVNDAVTSITANGKACGFNGATVSDNINFAADDFEIVSAEPVIDAGSYTYSLKFASDEYGKNFVLSQNKPLVKVSKLKIKVTPKTYSYTYDNSVKYVTVAEAVTAITTADGMEVAPELIGVDDFAVEYGEMRNAGIYDYNVRISDREKTRNFEMDVTTGTVTINRADVTVTIKDVERIYSGEEQLLDVYSAIHSISSSVTGVSRDDFEVVFEREESRVNVNDYAFTVRFYENAAATEDEPTGKSKNYNLKVQSLNGAADGAVLKVGQFVVDVTSASKEFTYNGEKQSESGFTVGALANPNHTMVVATAANRLPSVTNVGETRANALDYTIRAIIDGVTTDVTANYDIKDHAGTLTVAPRALTITTPTTEKYYDGIALTGKNFSHDGLADKDIIPTVTAAPGITDAGTIENKYVCEIRDGDTDEDVSRNYIITYKYGTLTVKAVEVTVTLQNVTKDYNGSQLVVTATDAVTGISNTALKTGDLTVTPDRTVLNAGTYSYSVSVADRKKAANFEISFAGSNGITVNKAVLNVTLEGVTAVYSGKVQTATAANITNISANYDGINKTNLTFTYSEPILNAGDYTFSVELTDERLGGNYELNVAPAKYTVKPLDVNVTLKNYTATYGNTEFKIDAIDAVEGISTDLLNANDFRSRCNAEIRNAGDYTYTMELIDAAKRKNFNIAGSGKFTVNKRSLVITLQDVVMTSDEYDNSFDDSIRDYVFDVTNNVTVSGTLADGDVLTFNVVLAEFYTESSGAVNDAFISIKEYDFNLTNSGNYDVQVSAVPARLVITA